MAGRPFRLRGSELRQEGASLKVGTDALVLGAWCDIRGAERILDIGTGTGILALMMAERAPEAAIHAVEIDERNAALAASNFARTPWRDRLHVHAMDIRRLRSAEPFDRIVSNPPFHDGTQRPLHDRRAVAKHGPDLSFPALIEVCDRLLSPTGRISLVLPLLRVKEMVSLAASNGLHPVRTFELCYVKDRPPKRALLELGRHPGLVDTGRLVVRGDSPLGYSPEVHRLLKDLLPAPTGSGRDLPLSE